MRRGARSRTPVDDRSRRPAAPRGDDLVAEAVKLRRQLIDGRNQLTAYRVSRDVGKVSNNYAGLVEPLAEDA